MDTKFLYGKIFLDDEDLKEANFNHKVSLEYYKINEIKKGFMGKNKETYGIEIVKKEYLGKDIIEEAIDIKNVTKRENKLDKILEKLKTCKVTPVGLEDVLKEII